MRAPELSDVEMEPPNKPIETRATPGKSAWIKEIRELQAKCEDRDRLHEEVKALCLLSGHIQGLS